MTHSSDSSADAQILGPLFQIERVIYWLSVTQKENANVCLEVDDDVSVRLKNGERLLNIFEQNKSTVVKGKNPLSNTSINLWKTLCNWANLIISQNIPIRDSKFLFVTNTTIPQNALIKEIHNLILKSKASQEQEIETKYDELLSYASKSKNKDIKKYYAGLQKLTRDQQLDLVKRIELIDNPKYITDRNTIKNEVRANLHIGSSMPFNSIYISMQGWVSDIAIEKWTKQEPAVISILDFNNFVSSTVAKYNSKSFIEQQKELLPTLTKQDIVDSYDKNYVKQLQWIDLDEDDIIEAMDHFNCAQIERKRYALENNKPTSKDFIDFEKKLINTWKAEYFNVVPLAQNDEDKVVFGKSIFYRIKNRPEYLAGQLTEQEYTIAGTYHKLADKFDIGWHIDFEKLKDK